MNFSKIRIIAYLGLILTQPIWTEEETHSLSSTHADYDGQTLTLTGQVTLDHGLGTMKAEKAQLQKQAAESADFPFSQIQLHRNVALALKSTAQVLCAHADLDFITLTGSLRAETGEKVSYTDTQKQPLQIFSQQLELNFSKNSVEKNKVDYDVSALRAQGDVEIHYAEKFHLTSDLATYTRTPLTQKMTALPLEAQGVCHLVHDRDHIDAASVDVDLTEELLLLTRPQGTLYTLSQSEPLNFHSDELTWYHKTHELRLKNKIHVEEGTLETLDAADEITLKHDLIDGKYLLKTLDAYGPSTLRYRDETRPSESTLLCQGHIHVDKALLQSTLSSPEINGQVPLDKQIAYRDNSLSLFADQASIDYVDSPSLRPTELTLKGHIRLQAPGRYALADRLHYSLLTRTLILSAHPGNKVLFFDASQQARMSANEIHITEDPETGQQAIKGVGHIRLALSPEENARLQQLFPQLRISQ